MRFTTELEAVRRMAEAQIIAARVREEREERESRHVLVAPHRYEDGSVLI